MLTEMCKVAESNKRADRTAMQYISNTHMIQCLRRQSCRSYQNEYGRTFPTETKSFN